MMKTQRSLPKRAMIQVLKRLIPTGLQPTPYISQLVTSRTQFTVQSGPFRGMRYLSLSRGSALLPKLLGIYERELTPSIEEAIRLGIDTVINIGAGEGYYAVGIAIRMPQTTMIAFEMDASAQRLIAKLAALNGVQGRVRVAGECTVQSLVTELQSGGSKLVICDAEGAEEFLLDPVMVPQLKQCFILVELHDFITSGLSELIKVRFNETHEIEHIWQEERDLSDFPYRNLYAKAIPKYVIWAVSEHRPCRMAWYWMRPRRSN